MATGAASRCAAHPSRPSVDSCPVCGRARCGVDVERYAASGCPACSRQVDDHRPQRPELIVRAGLAAYAVGVVGGWLGTQYVRESVFSWLIPGLVGLAVAGSAAAASRGLDRGTTFAVSAGGAIASAALAFTLTPGGQSPLHPLGLVLPPYLAAVVGVAAWPVLFGPSGRRRHPPDAAIER